MKAGLLATATLDLSHRDAILPTRERNLYSLMGFFCEHKKYPGKFVFLEPALEQVVNILDQDPVNCERILPRNYKEVLAQRLQARELFVFRVPHEREQHPAISSNYDRFELYERVGNKY